MVDSRHTIEPVAYRINDACAVMGIGRNKLYDLVAEGRLDLVKLGRSSRITAASVRALFDKGSS